MKKLDTNTMAKGLELTKILEDKTIKGIYFGVIERARQTAEVCLLTQKITQYS